MKIHSDRVKKLRTAKNWSQEQLSEVCGLSLRTIQRLEKGGNPSIESIRALAAAFEVDPKELIFIEGEDSPTPLDAIKTGFLQFGNFSGTATRFEYWWFFLFVLVVTAVAAIIHERAYQIVAVIFLLPLIAAGTRRLNDAGRSGWWQRLLLVPFRQIVVLYLLAQASSRQLGQRREHGLDVA